MEVAEPIHNEYKINVDIKWYASKPFWRQVILVNFIYYVIFINSHKTPVVASGNSFPINLVLGGICSINVGFFPIMISVLDMIYTYKPLQLFVCTGAWTICFLTGMLVGAPTVLIPQIKREVNSTYELNPEMVSWLYSVYGLGALPWVLIAPTASQFVGRRLPIILVNFNVILVLLILYFSTTTKHILISEIMQGYIQSCDMTICIIILAEYSSPKYRGIFLTFKIASFCWGFWVSNFIGTFFHWKNIALFGLVMCCYPFTSFFWPESPQWLASRGRYDECKASFRWLNGVTDDSEKELKNLIESQMKYLLTREQNRKSCTLKEYHSIEFYKPLFILTIIITHFFFTSKFVSSIYVLDIIKSITKNERTAYIGMLILDGFTVFGVYCGCGLTKIFNRRTMYLVSSSIVLFLLFTMSLYLYLVKLTLVEENKILSIFLLTCLAIIISGGPMSLTAAFFGEVTPLKYKSVLFPIIACEFMMYSTTVLKFAPQVFTAFGLHGTFLMYGIVTSVCTYVLYIYLPETKDKTLQEIENYFKKNEPKTSAQSKEETEVFVEHNMR